MGISMVEPFWPSGPCYCKRMQIEMSRRHLVEVHDIQRVGDTGAVSGTMLLFNS